MKTQLFFLRAFAFILAATFALLFAANVLKVALKVIERI